MNWRRTRLPVARLSVWKAIRSEVEAAVYSATEQETSAIFRYPFQFALGATAYLPSKDGTTTVARGRLFLGGGPHILRCRPAPRPVAEFDRTVTDLTLSDKKLFAA